MVARVPVHLACLVEDGQTPAPAGDHEGRPYGLSGLLRWCSRNACRNVFETVSWYYQK
jgi:hypothetical protein